MIRRVIQISGALAITGQAKRVTVDVSGVTKETDCHVMFPKGSYASNVRSICKKRVRDLKKVPGRDKKAAQKAQKIAGIKRMDDIVATRNAEKRARRVKKRQETDRRVREHGELYLNFLLVRMGLRGDDGDEKCFTSLTGNGGRVSFENGVDSSDAEFDVEGDVMVTVDHEALPHFVSPGEFFVVAKPKSKFVEVHKVAVTGDDASDYSVKTVSDSYMDFSGARVEVKESLYGQEAVDFSAKLDTAYNTLGGHESGLRWYYCHKTPGMVQDAPSSPTDAPTDPPTSPTDAPTDPPSTQSSDTTCTVGQSDFCQNGGTCQDNGGATECSCTQGYQGDSCTEIEYINGYNQVMVNCIVDPATPDSLVNKYCPCNEELATDGITWYMNVDLPCGSGGICICRRHYD